MARILVVDNYDSFVFNLVQYLAQLGAEVDRAAQRRGDARTRRASSTASCCRPGPGTPEDAGVCMDIVRAVRRRRADLRRVPGTSGDRGGLRRDGVAARRSCCTARRPRCYHDDVGVLAGLPDPFTATRYHSLAVEPATVPGRARGHRAPPSSGVIMALRHRDLPVEGVQFHPESVLTEGGHLMLANWLVECGDPGAVERVRRAWPRSSG